MRGRKPKPTKLHILEGTYRPDRKNQNEPTPDPCIPEPPDHIQGAALDEWRRISPELAAIGLLSNVDRNALAACCQLWATIAEAEEKLRTCGLVATTTNGTEIQSPWLGIRNKALALYHKYLVEFGMTPSSRGRLGVKGQPKDSKFSGVIGGKKT